MMQPIINFIDKLLLKQINNKYQNFVILNINILRNFECFKFLIW
jgi:hypothetical protein